MFDKCAKLSIDSHTGALLQTIFPTRASRYNTLNDQRDSRARTHEAIARTESISAVLTFGQGYGTDHELLSCGTTIEPSI